MILKSLNCHSRFYTFFQFPEINSNDTVTNVPLRNTPADEDFPHNKGPISIADMSTLICKNFKDNAPQHQTYEVDDFDGQIDIKYQPMMPLTIELMRRKSLYYMGLEQSLFFRLLYIIQTTMCDVTDALMLEMKLMLVLRKHRWNEEFEALGDLFDIDIVTAQQYYDELKDLICNLYHSLASTMSTTPIIQETNDVKNPFWTEQHQIDDESEQSSSDLDVKYKGYISEDKDFASDDIKSDMESDTESDTNESIDSDSDLESDEKESEKNVVKETVRCPVCRRSVGRLDYHMETNHLNPQSLNKTLCGLCFGKFQTHKRLRDHQTKEHSGASCVCDVCGKFFQKFSAVKEHILKVHSKCKPFLCHQCGTSYFSLSKLKIHTQNVHMNIRNHECKLCNKKYFQAMELQNHIRAVHTKDRPFHCRFNCGKSFCRSGSRYTHEQIHKAKFKCEICMKDFSFRHNLQTHCKNIHGKNVIDTEKCKIEIM